MRNHILLLCFLCNFLSNSLAQTSEDCVDAHILAPAPILLTDVASITVDEVLGIGNEPAELLNFSVDECSPDGYTTQSIDKSYWIAFSAVTDGELEFMISPENMGTDYDFALFKGFCPNDLCSESMLCIWRSTFCVNYTPTGVSADPLTTFGVDPTNNIQISPDPVELQAGQNYFLLVENRNEVDNPECGVEDSLGFTIDFAGTATVGPLLERPQINPVAPADTSQPVIVCAGDIQTFEVTTVPFAANYDWVTHSTVRDAVITPSVEGNVATVTFGQESGQVCMEIVCPVQSTICWDVVVEPIPDLMAINPTVVDCEPVDLNDRVVDQNPGETGVILFFETEQDAENGQNPLQNSVVKTSGTYWAKKTSSNGCVNIIAVSITTEVIEMVPFTEPITVCGTFFDFVDLEIENAIPNGDNLVFRVYKDSLEAVNNQSVITPPMVDQPGRYWIRAEKQVGGLCWDVQPVDLIFDLPPEVNPIPLQQICQSECLNTTDLLLTEANGRDLSAYQRLFYDNEADAQANTVPNSLSELCVAGNYWLRVEGVAGCFDVLAFQLELGLMPEMNDTTLAIDCNSGCIDLEQQSFVEVNGLAPENLSYQFFNVEADANDPAATPVGDLNICSAAEIWVRVTFIPTGCFGVAKITVSGIDLSTAALSGEATVCSGESSVIDFNFTGVAPFTFVYSDGRNTFERTSDADFFQELLTPDSTTTYTLISLTDANGCIGNVSGMATLTIDQGPQLLNFSQDCNLTATDYTISFELEAGKNYQVVGVAGTLTGTSFVSDPISGGESYSFQVIPDNGCPSPLFSDSFNCACNSVAGDLDVAIVIQKNISCSGENDAILSAEPVNGTAPYTYNWSLGNTSQAITGVAPGRTSVTVTDANGCVLMDSIDLDEPESITASVTVSPISCYGEKDGSLMVLDVFGGTGTYSYSFSGGVYQSVNYSENYSSGIYDIIVKDENDCIWTQQAVLEDPPQLAVSLGGDQVLNLGDSLSLLPQYNQDIISIEWESNDPSLCAACDRQVVSPFRSERYKVVVTNSAGCEASDEILVQIQNNRRIYVPSAFSPNGDGRNDILRPFGGSEISEITTFRVFNRWGEKVYEQENMLKEGSDGGWNGLAGGKRAPVGVYLYYLEVSFQDGGTDIVTGDITLTR